MKLIAITGGIGSGKSVVSCVLRVMGYPVYDCDSEAKRLMVTSQPLIDGICRLLGPDAYCVDGTLNRPYMSSRLFGDPALVTAVNSLVHPAVIQDIQRWAQESHSPLAFVETALLRESNMIPILDGVWTVTAPLELRIARVARRSNLTEQQTRDRIANQSNDIINGSSVITNDGSTPILPQVLTLLDGHS